MTFTRSGTRRLLLALALGASLALGAAAGPGGDAGGPALAVGCGWCTREAAAPVAGGHALATATPATATPPSSPSSRRSVRPS